MRVDEMRPNQILSWQDAMENLEAIMKDCNTGRITAEHFIRSLPDFQHRLYEIL